MTISKIEAAQLNISDSIILYISKRYFGSWTLAATAYNCTHDLIKNSKNTGVLDKFCKEIPELEDLQDNIRKLWNKLKHADREQDNLYFPNDEDCRALITFTIIDLTTLLKDIKNDHKIFLAWYSSAFTPVSKQFESLGKKYFPSIREYDLDAKISYLKVFLDKNYII